MARVWRPLPRQATANSLSPFTISKAKAIPSLPHLLRFRRLGKATLTTLKDVWLFHQVRNKVRRGPTWASIHKALEAIMPLATGLKRPRSIERVPRSIYLLLGITMQPKHYYYKEKKLKKFDEVLIHSEEKTIRIPGPPDVPRQRCEWALKHIQFFKLNVILCAC